MLLLLVSGVAWGAPKRYALIIGNNAAPASNPSGLAQLSYADDDAARYHGFFEQFADEVRVLTVLDASTERRFSSLATKVRAPTLGELDRAIAQLAQEVEADRSRGDESVFYFVFSGHGARNEKGEFFLSLLDAELDRARLFERVLTRMPATWVHLLVDACHAEAAVGLRGAGELDVQTTPLTEKELESLVVEPTLGRFPHVGAVVATGADEQAHEWSRIQSGVFTHVLLSGLSGAADANADGAVEYSELAAFVSAAQAEVPDARAVPKVLAVPPRANAHLPLASTSWMRRSVLLEGTAQLGRFFIEALNGTRWVEAHLQPGMQARIALPPGEMFLVVGEQEAAIRAESGARVRADRLQLSARRSTARGALDSSLREGLFAATYGPSYYRGFVDSRGLPRAVFLEETAGAVEVGSGWRKPASLSAFGLAALGAGGAATFGLLAAGAYRDAETAELQRPAHEARERYLGLGRAAVISGISAGVFTAAGWVLWPSAPANVWIAPDGVSVVGTW